MRIYLRAEPRAIMANCFCKPAKFGAVLPAGCLPEPPNYATVASREVDGAMHIVAAQFDASYVEWIGKVETELADVCGLDGEARKMATGRAAGPRFALKPALGHVGSPLPRASPVTCAWRTVAAWLLQVQRGLAVTQDPMQQPNLTALCVVGRVLKRFRLHTWQDMGAHDGAASFHTWFDSIQRGLLYQAQYVVVLRMEAVRLARAAAEGDIAARRRSWLSWLHEGPAAGIGRQHRMSRVAGGWIPSAVDHAAFDRKEDDDLQEDAAESVELRTLDRRAMPLHSQQEVEREARSWATIWQADSQPPAPVWPAIMGEPLPGLCLIAALQACAAFPADTGLGWDNLHPRALRRVSDEAIAALLRIFMMAEMLGRWPDMIGAVIIALLPKLGGGNRPIGLCPSLIRLWMRMRLSVAQAWQSANDRPYFFAGEAKGADVAAWQQAARAEAGICDGPTHAVALLDLVKAFDSIPWDWLVRQAAARGYNLSLLRLSLAAYALARSLRCGKNYSKLVVAHCGITAGGALATTELRVLLIEFLDHACTLDPRTRLTVYVDDM